MQTVQSVYRGARGLCVMRNINLIAPKLILKNTSALMVKECLILTFSYFIVNKSHILQLKK